MPAYENSDGWNYLKLMAEGKDINPIVEQICYLAYVLNVDF